MPDGHDPAAPGGVRIEWNQPHPAFDAPMLLLEHVLQSRPPAGQSQYDTISVNRIVEMMQTPQRVEKLAARAFIASAYAEADGRDFKVQGVRGSYPCAVLDFDDTPAEVDDDIFDAAVSEALGGAARAWFSTTSATVSNPRRRLLIPLAAPVSGGEYPEVCMAIGSLITAELLASSPTPTWR